MILPKQQQLSMLGAHNLLVLLAAGQPPSLPPSPELHVTDGLEFIIHPLLGAWHRQHTQTRYSVTRYTLVCCMTQTGRVLGCEGVLACTLNPQPQTPNSNLRQ